MATKREMTFQLCMLLITALTLLLRPTCAVRNDKFFEELYVKPLESGHVYFHFQFTSTWNASIHNSHVFQHYHFFPKSLGDVLAAYQVQELHLTQTQGVWRHKIWGYPLEDAPPGAELWVWFKPEVKDVDKTWAELVNAVSGLFCSSLNFLDAKSTVAPRWSFRPRGLASKTYATSSQFVRYGALPHEVVCTENLTPWKKLLPCDSKAGLASLFKADRIYDADYHSLTVHFRPICADPECKADAMELTQSLALVVDATIDNNRYQNWSIRKVFGQPLTTQCPLATTSRLFVDTSDNLEKHKFTLTPEPSQQQVFLRGGKRQQFAIYDIGQFTSVGKALNVAAGYESQAQYGLASAPPVYAHRYITGYGLETGGIGCQIHNTLDTPLSILYMESLPWFTRVFFKSLKVENRGREVPYKVHYLPGRDRERSYHIEMAFSLAPLSVTKVSFQFERAFLKWTEYPPDANHGFYINSAVISTMLPKALQLTALPLNASTIAQIMNDNSTQFFLRLHTESLLVSLPTPDFSMPYNVICLACTVVAVAFGSVHNLTTRRFVLLDPAKTKGLLARLKSLLNFRRKKLANETPPTEEADSEDRKRQRQLEERDLLKAED